MLFYFLSKRESETVSCGIDKLMVTRIVPNKNGKILIPNLIKQARNQPEIGQ